MSHWVACACVLWFVIVMIKERRSLWSGLSFIAMSVSCGMTLLTLPQEHGLLAGNWWVHITVFATVFATLLLLSFGPFGMLLVLGYSAWNMMRREGMLPRHLLSLCVLLLLIGYVIGWPFVTNVTRDRSMWTAIYGYVGLSLVYLFGVSAVYTLSSLLNMLPVWPASYDYIVVLGSDLQDGHVTPLLASRLNQAIKLYRRKPQCQLIVSGGKGDDALRSEAAAMAEYVMMQDVPEQAVIMEDRSRNTHENIRYSARVMSGKKRFVLVTNHFHLFRALLLARIEHLPCRGVGAPTKLYYSANAFVREFAGYLLVSWRIHAVLFGLISCGYFTALAYLGWQQL